MLVKLDAYEDGSPIIVATDSVESLRVRWREQAVITVRTKSGGEEIVRGNLADVAAKLGFTGSIGTETPAPSEPETPTAETGACDCPVPGPMPIVEHVQGCPLDGVAVTDMERREMNATRAAK